MTSFDSVTNLPIIRLSKWLKLYISIRCTTSDTAISVMVWPYVLPISLYIRASAVEPVWKHALNGIRELCDTCKPQSSIFPGYVHLVAFVSAQNATTMRRNPSLVREKRKLHSNLHSRDFFIDYFRYLYPSEFKFCLPFYYFFCVLHVCRYWGSQFHGGSCKMASLCS